MRKTLSLFVLAIVLLGLVHISPLPAHAQEPEPTRSIEFQPSIMEQVTFQYDRVNHWFELAYQQYFMRFKPFAIVDGQTWTQQQTVTYLRNQGATYREIIDVFKTSIHWGYDIDLIPEEDQAKINALGFKLTDYNFPLSVIDVENIQGTSDTYGEYTYQEFTIPQINLKWSFQDLYEKGFTVTFVNKTYMLIGNVANKERLLIDPITYSAPTMTTIGGTLANPLTFWDLWNASNVNGWNVINNTQDHQFYFWCRLNIGDNSNPTYFNDTMKEIVIDRSVVTGPNQAPFYQYGESIVTFGERRSGVERRGTKGIMMYYDEVAYSHYFWRCQNNQAQLNIYASWMGRNTSSYDNVYLLCNNGSIYDTILHEPFMYLCSDIELNNVYFTEGVYAVYESTFSYMNDVIASGQIDTFFVRETNNELVYHDTTVYQGTADLLQYQTSANLTLIFLDIQSDVWNLDHGGGATTNCTLFRQYRFTLNVTDASGNPIQNALVTIYYDGLGTRQEHDSLYTASDGSITQQNLTMGHWLLNGSDYRNYPQGFYDYNPYLFTVEHSSYQTYTSTFILTEAVNWTIAMLDPTVTLMPIVVDTATDLTPFVLFLVCGLCITLALIGLLVPFVGFLAVILSVLILIPIPLSSVAYILALQVGTLVFCSAMLIISLLRRNSMIDQEEYERTPAYKRR